MEIQLRFFDSRISRASARSMAWISYRPSDTESSCIAWQNRRHERSLWIRAKAFASSVLHSGERESQMCWSFSATAAAIAEASIAGFSRVAVVSMVSGTDTGRAIPCCKSSAIGDANENSLRSVLQNFLRPFRNRLAQADSTPDSKSGVPQGTGGSNPSLSAILAAKNGLKWPISGFPT